MARYIEAAPESTGLQAFRFRLQLHVPRAEASTVVGLDVIEELDPQQPRGCG